MHIIAAIAAVGWIALGFCLGVATVIWVMFSPSFRIEGETAEETAYRRHVLGEIYAKPRC